MKLSEKMSKTVLKNRRFGFQYISGVIGKYSVIELLDTFDYIQDIFTRSAFFFAVGEWGQWRAIANPTRNPSSLPEGGGGDFLQENLFSILSRSPAWNKAT